MIHPLERRAFLGASFALAAACTRQPKKEAAPKQTKGAESSTDPHHAPDNGPHAHEIAPAQSKAVQQELLQLEKQSGGRLGVYAFRVGLMQVVAHRESELFAMCSTFKALLAAAVLQKVDLGGLSLQQQIEFGEEDLLDYAPVCREKYEAVNSAEKSSKVSLSVEELSRAAVTLSDNTAANLLLAQIGGPAGLTKFLRKLGDRTTRLDRNEPSLNENLKGDARDSTSPRAMAESWQAMLMGDVLSEASAERLADWLVKTQTGLSRLRAGFPESLKAGDKTGTGNRGACNDVAVLWPEDGPPLFIASYLSGATVSLDKMNEIHAKVGALVARVLL